jgi:hypothetical protein
MPLVSPEVEPDYTGARQAAETTDNLNGCISGAFRHAATGLRCIENLLARNI